MAWALPDSIGMKREAAYALFFLLPGADYRYPRAWWCVKEVLEYAGRNGPLRGLAEL